MPSNSNLIINIISLMKMGAVPVPVSNLLSKESYDHICQNVKPAAIYTTLKNTFFPSFDSTLLENDFIGGYNLLTYTSETFVNEKLKHCIIITTSGSTGFPKSVVHSNSNAMLNALLHMDAINEIEDEKGTYIATLPFFFSYGLIAGIFGALLKGKNIIIPEHPFYPSTWEQYCLKHQVTLASLTPGVLKKILKTNISIPYTLNKITIGGESADLEDINSLKEKFEGEIYLTYGLSEAGPRVATNNLNIQNNTNSIGFPMRNIRLDLKDIQITEDYEIGELIIDTPTAMLGYLKDGQIIKESEFYNNWLLTGDYFKKNVNTKEYTFIERKKNTFKCAGENLYPGIIRKVILSHPDVDEVKITFEEDKRLGAIPIALIKLKKAGIKTPDFKKWCVPHLRLIEIPKEFRVVKELEFFKK